MANSQGRGTNAELFELPVIRDVDDEPREPYPMWRTTGGKRNDLTGKVRGARPNPHYRDANQLPEGCTS